MKGKLHLLLIRAFFGSLLGGGIGTAYGQLQFERAWQQVQTDPRSVQGDPGSYLCLMGDAPLVWGMLGGLIGVVTGASVSAGCLILRRKKF